ncbi:MAG TPA: lysophospholipid acyltransferase family protein [Thermoanaerobaculia bacterium]|nr:lysophospholipid acyltransferase family protein [Thermoanaerobaculia bacterium]
MSLKYTLLYAALRVLARLAGLLPLPTARAIGRFLGRLAWHVVRRERRRALDHIKLAFPDWSEEQREHTIRAMFRHLGQSLMEILWLPRLDEASRARLTQWEGLEKLKPYLDAGRGVVIFTAHCGNWEWLANAFGALGAPTSVLQRERSDPKLNRFITEVRARVGVQTIDRGSNASARQMLTAIKRGALAFVIDQNIRTDSVQVPFFGQPALTPIGPARLAVRAEAVVVTILIERRADGTHLARVSEPIETRREDDPVALTARATRQIEEQIRRVPEQWVWMHRRWRDRPRWDVSSRHPE